MNDVAEFVEDMRERVQGLRDAGVQRAEFAPDGRVLLAGEGFALILGTDDASSTSLLLAPPPAPAPAAAAVEETPKERTDRRAAEIVETRSGAARNRGPLPGDALKTGVHMGRHPMRAGRCEKCGKCEKCGGRWDENARDEFSESDPHCISCGARPIRSIADIEPENGRAEHRGSKNGVAA